MRVINFVDHLLVCLSFVYIPTLNIRILVVYLGIWVGVFKSEYPIFGYPKSEYPDKKNFRILTQDPTRINRVLEFRVPESMGLRIITEYLNLIGPGTLNFTLNYGTCFCFSCQLPCPIPRFLSGTPIFGNPYFRIAQRPGSQVSQTWSTGPHIFNPLPRTLLVIFFKF